MKFHNNNLIKHANRATLALLTSALIFSCTKNKKDENPYLLLAKNLMSTRAQNTTHFVAIVKLKNPALLESSQKQDGRAVIDEKLLSEINKEQEEAIATLKALSSEVQVVFRYKMVLNAVAVFAPIELESKIKNLGLIAYSEASGNFNRPEMAELSNSVDTPAFLTRNSAKFIGAEKLNLAGITGRGIKVGIIDTGIDYTHAMFLGEGTSEAFKAINPDVATSAFPNKKVVGGIDLAGTEFDSGSPVLANRIPKPDVNPIDEAGHGSHVAGTVAGIGDGINTYNGMAPDADLYAIKVFGAQGSTSDVVVIAALEYSVDPDADGNNSDQLDVVNLSLGSSYGNPHILYSEAIKNLVNGGTVVVASAGNSGHKDYIVGAPGTSDAALSVAASVDNGDHLWKFNASQFSFANEKLLVEAIEAATTKKIDEAGDVQGKLVAAGVAAVDFTDEEKTLIKGNIALIDRGQVSFNDKIKRAVSAGAIGVVVANNKEGAPISMGTTDPFEIPAIMITLVDAVKVKEALKLSEVNFKFKTDQKIEKPQIIDTLTDFTSKGPRSVDGFIKPEISAPGENIISAEMGGGKNAVQMSGTSMAAPHMAGVVALVKQAQKKLSAEEIKSVVMGTSKTIADQKGSRYPISLQGSGRVQADKAAESKIVVMEPSLSLGEVGIEIKKVLRRKLNIKNLSEEKLSLDVVFQGNGFITMSKVASVAIEAGKTEEISVSFILDATSMVNEKIRDMDGWVMLKQGDTELYRVPVLAVAHKLSSLEASKLIVSSTSELDSAGTSAEVTLNNKNMNSGEAYLFNLIGTDQRKPQAPDFMNADCDLQAAGYRLVTKKVNNKNVDVLQVAIKLFKPMTTWNACDISLLIDSNQDGKPDQELLGANLRSIPGQSADEFMTTLIDAKAARELRTDYENALAAAKGDKDALAKLKGSEDYSDALVAMGPMKLFNNSTVVILEIATDNLALTESGALAFKVVVTHNEQSSVEFDDSLSSTVKTDMLISLRKEDQAYINLPESVMLAANQNKNIELTKGEGFEKLLVLMPNNKFSQSNLHDDSQMQILSPVFLAP